MLLNLIKHQGSDIDKTYLFSRDSFESKYQLLINGREKVGIKEQKIQRYLLIEDTNLQFIHSFKDIHSQFKYLTMFITV